MAKKTTRKKSLLKKLKTHYRILVINDDTYEEKLSFRLNRLNVYVATAIFAFVLIMGTIVLIAFTPLRTYIPGYTAPGLRKNAVRLQLRADSLEKALMLNTYYLNELKKVLNNEITFEEFNKKYSQKEFNPDTLKLHPGKVDSLLREEVANRERFQVQQQNNHLAYNFVNPVKGVVVNGFNPEKEHYGIDIALKTETPVKSIAEGRVIFAGWSSDTGNTIIINHPNDIISVYKHNKKLLRKTGDWVQAGEVVALSGNSGEQTTGPHLHFELWMKDTPVDPLDFLSFK